MLLKNKTMDGSSFLSKWKWLVVVEVLFWIGKLRGKQLVMLDCVIKNFKLKPRHLIFVLGRMVYDDENTIK